MRVLGHIHLAFPALASWLSQAVNIDSGRAVFFLGHYTLATLVFALQALWTIMAGGQFLVTMALGAGLFAKVYDSGYPTVVSQLGLVVGLLVLPQTVIESWSPSH